VDPNDAGPAVALVVGHAPGTTDRPAPNQSRSTPGTRQKSLKNVTIEA
jgi:hypothetical protein